MELEARLDKAQGQAEALQESTTAFQHQLQSARKQIGKLEGLARECESIPGLRKDLATATSTGDRLQQERDLVQVPQICTWPRIVQHWISIAIYVDTLGYL